jgi:hypothetical protein
MKSGRNETSPVLRPIKKARGETNADISVLNLIALPPASASNNYMRSCMAIKMLRLAPEPAGRTECEAAAYKQAAGRRRGVRRASGIISRNQLGREQREISCRSWLLCVVSSHMPASAIGGNESYGASPKCYEAERQQVGLISTIARENG